MSSLWGPRALGVLTGLCLMAVTGLAQPVNDNFASAIVLAGGYGTTNVDNSTATSQPGEPPHAGFRANASVWYQWRAPANGEVTMDTLSTFATQSNPFTGQPQNAYLETVLAVYTGPDVAHLTQIAANDFQYPMQMVKYGAIDPNLLQANISLFPTGPSLVRFNAVSNTVYYVALDSKPGNRGTLSFNWAMHSSGMFRWATEQYDTLSTLPLFVCADGEGEPDSVTTWSTFYQYGVPGVLATVTRVGGSTGRVLVDYATQDGLGSTNAAAGIDYTNATGTLVFDDNEMSKSILIPIAPPGFPQYSPLGPPLPISKDFNIQLSNPRLDAAESPLVSPPRLDATMTNAIVRIITTTGPDPYNMTPGYDPYLFTVGTTLATHDFFGFQRVHYRVPRDVATYYANVTVWVNRYPNPANTSADSATINYQVNNLLQYSAPEEQLNNEFALQAESDYAITSPPETGFFAPNYSDFILAQGTVNIPVGSPAAPINFSIPMNGVTELNKDFHITLYRDIDGAPTWPSSSVEAVVTILFDDNTPPAGAVDQYFNPDHTFTMVVPQPVNSDPPDNVAPGADGQVMSIFVLTNAIYFTNTVVLTNNGVVTTNLVVTSQTADSTMIGGDFASYDTHRRNRIARVTYAGWVDESFDPGDGPNAFVDAVLPNGNGGYFIAGAFSSYQSVLRSGVAMVQGNGNLDPTFTPGFGANGTVRTALALPGGKYLIAGDFTTYNLTNCSHIALINSDGSLDPTFTANAPVFTGESIYALAVNSAGRIFVGGAFSAVGSTAVANIACLNSNGTVYATFGSAVSPGADGTVLALALDNAGRLILGGAFQNVADIARSRIARVTANGVLDHSFNPGSGADDNINSINAQADGTAFIAGQFLSYNGTRRLGAARILADGTLDTTFLDGTFNQFAGLHRFRFSEPVGVVLASAIQSDGALMIGGDFSQVGGGQANILTRIDPNNYTLDTTNNLVELDYTNNVWMEPKARNGIRIRSNYARLIGGATRGPGNLNLTFTNYNVNKSDQKLSITLNRLNGSLGYLSANFQVVSNVAAAGSDYSYYADAPVFQSDWLAPYNVSANGGTSRQYEDAMEGTNIYPINAWGGYYFEYTPGQVNVDLVRNSYSGDRSALFQLANPPGADVFFLGGANIPVGEALGNQSAQFTIVDDSHQVGVIGFAQALYTVTEGQGQAIITLSRTNGSYGQVSVNYTTTAATSTNAVIGVDYWTTNGTLQFAAGVTNMTFAVPIIQNTLIQPKDRIVGLALSRPTLGSLGASNASLSIIDDNYPLGYVRFDSAGYTNVQSAGSVVATVTRVGSARGVISVVCSTTNNSTAQPGVNYVTVLTNLTWNSGDSTPRYVAVPLLNDGTVGQSTALGLVLSNPIGYATNAPLILGGSHTTAEVGIVDDNYYGTLEFSETNYVVNESGGYATLTVVRNGGTTQTLTVNYATSDGPGTFYQGEGTTPNYVATSGTLVFEPGQVAASFTVPVIDDGVVDPTTGFYFNVSLSGVTPVGANLGSPATATVTLIDVEAVNAPPGALDPNFNPTVPGFNGDITAVQVQTNGQIVVGGAFTLASGISMNHLARVNTDASLDANFMAGLSGANAPVNAVLLQSDTKILVGGAFTNLNSLTRNHIARLLPDGSPDQSFSPGAAADGPVYSLAEAPVTGGGSPQLLVGGNFTYFNGLPHSSLARLNLDGGLDAAFTPVLTSGCTIYSIAVYPLATLNGGDILIAGDFTAVDGYPRNGIARLNPDGSLDTTFDPGLGATNAVRSAAIQLDGRIVLGGSFTYFNGAAYNHVVRLNGDGSIDTTFNVGVGTDDTVNSVVLQEDNRIILGGDFTFGSGVHRSRITRLSTDGTVDPSINFGLGADGNIDSVALDSVGNIVVGGGFSNFNGQPRSHLARIWGGSLAGYGALTFVQGNFTVDENGTNALITVERTGGTFGPVGITFRTANGTGTNAAIAGINYTAVTTNLTFGNGETLQTVTVPISQDFKITPDLVANLSLTSPQDGASLGDQYLATLTIFNDDSSISFSSTNYAFPQNVPSGSGLIQLQRLGSSRLASSISFYTTTNGTALAGTDYLAVSNAFLFPVGQTNVNIFVPILNNPLMLNNTTVGLQITNAVNSLALSPVQATMVILTTNGSAGQFVLAQTNYSVAENAGVVAVTVLRTNGQSGPVSVNFATVAGTNATSAIPGVNFVATNGVLSFGDGELTKTLYVTVLNAQQAGPDSTFGVQLSGAVGATISGPATATVTLVNVYQGIGFRNAVYVTNETAGAVVLIIDRLLTNDTTTVQYSTADGTAVAGVNYTASSGLLTFQPGQSTESLSIPVRHDPRVTGSLSFSVNLQNPSAPAVLYPNATALVNLLDADAGVSLSTNFYGVLKSGTNVIVSVTRSNANTGVVSVNFATTNGTALAGQDYYQTNGTLFFSNGIALQSFSIPIINNHVIEGDRSFQVLIFTTPANLGAAQLLTNSVAKITITDDVSGLSFSAPSYQVSEKGGYAVIGVQRSGYTNSSVSVDFTTIAGTNANSAAIGVNYYPTNGTLLFTNGQTSLSFAVPVIDDNRVDGDHVLLLDLSNPLLTNSPVGYALLTSPSAATLAITEADGSEVISAGSAFTFTRSYTNSAPLGLGGAHGTNSAISVTNLSSQVEKVVAHVPSATTPAANDLGLLLAGPSGVLVGLAGNAGSSALNHTSLTFDDWAAGPLPQNTVLTNGSYQPAVYGSLPWTQPYATKLGAFADSLPGGAWTLYAADDSAPYGGALDIGWSLDLTCLETNVNRYIVPWETVTMLFAFRDAAGFGVTNLVATLAATNGVSNPSAPQTYGPLVPNGPSVSRLFSFTANATNGQSIAAVFHLQDGARALNDVVVNLLVGTAGVTFSNTAPIHINDDTVATPYPSQITVSGVGSVVTKTTATLTNLAHTYPRDIDILLVSPTGQKSYLMSKAGGGYSITNVTLTFDDTAASGLPTTLITNGTYKPTSYAVATPPFPPTSTPVGPYLTNMATFTGNNPNGTWSLYVIDDTPLNAGIISNGWSITLLTSSPLPLASDVGVAVSPSVTTAIVTSNITFTVTVNNYGPAVATNVVVANTLPAGATFSAAPAVGTLSTNAGGQLVWNVGTMLKGAQAVLPVTVWTTLTGTAVFSSSVSSDMVDSNTGDSQASAAVTVLAPTAQLVLGLASLPNLVPLGNSYTVVAVVTNLGPATAPGVALSLYLDPSLELVSTTPLTGPVVGGVLTFGNLGDVPSGGTVTASVVVQPTKTGAFNTFGTSSSGVSSPLKAEGDNTVKTLVVGPLLLQYQASAAGLVLSWPASEGLYSLETATNLSAPVTWTIVTSTPTLVGSNYYYTNAVGSGTSFFRLVGAAH